MLWFSRKAATMIFCAALPVSISAQTASPGIHSRPQTSKPSPVLVNRPAAPYAAATTRGSRQDPGPRIAAPLAVRAPQPLQPSLQQLQANAAIAAPKAPAMPPAPEHVIPAAPLPNADADGAFAVDYRGGRLSVVAEKAELGKVLRRLGEKTGASIEVAPEVEKEPVVARLGPAATNQVLSELLDSPHLEYIVMGSDDGQTLKRIVVRRRASFARQPLVTMKIPAAQPPGAGAQMTDPQPADHETPLTQSQDDPPQQ
jgi:hypothetical protein